MKTSTDKIIVRLVDGTFFEAKSAQGIVGLMRRGSFEDGRLTVRSGGVGFALGPDGAGVE
jgi:hypothetical protein